MEMTDLEFSSTERSKSQHKDSRELSKDCNVNHEGQLYDEIYSSAHHGVPSSDCSCSKFRFLIENFAFVLD